jgi:hypothetical protein
MKQGRSLTELAAELERQQLSKRDFVTPTTNLSAVAVDGGVNFKIEDGSLFTGPATRHAQTQIAQHTKVPQVYFDKMMTEAPELLATNLNHWFKTNKSSRMIRTLDGGMRAMLSDRYRAIDNYDIAQATMPILINTPGIEVMSSEITANRMYIKAVSNRITAEVKKGDIVQAGIVISNGEIGNGSVKVEAFFYRLLCLNGMIGEASLRRYHVGRAAGELDAAIEVFRTETREADDRALMMKVSDVVRGALNEDRLQSFVRGLAAAAEVDIAPAPDKVAALIAKTYQLSEDDGGGILRMLASGNQGAGYTQWGLANSITALANEEKSYDKATELERIGGEIAFMPRQQFTDLVAAA